jgi:hypothetical protein
MAFKLEGPVSQTLRVDAEGHREYRVKFKMTTDLPGLDGPQQAYFCPGLPLAGAFYQIKNDIDLWAWCREDADITPEREGEPSRVYFATQLFSTKPPEPDKMRCNTTQVQSPLLEPPKISGNFSKYTEESAFDRFGVQITYSSFEPIRGRPVEFDNNRPTVRIETNVANLNWPLCAALVDTVNALPMWGLPKRCVKLTNVSWERKFYGTCSVYYTRTLEFEIDYNTWDRNIPDVSNLALRGFFNAAGHWELRLIGGQLPNPNNPSHYEQIKDRSGNNVRMSLNGGGLPAGVCIDLRCSRRTSTTPVTRRALRYIADFLL